MNSSELKGFIAGLILGDGTIDKGVTKRAFRIKSINEDFVDYIAEELSESTPFKIEALTFGAETKDGVSRKQYKELRIKAHPYFNKKYHFFYDDFRKRRITSESLAWLNPRGLAAWYMSDGYVTHVGKTKGKIVDRRVELCTDRYSEEDVAKIKRHFEDTYGYTVKMVKRREGVYRLRISLLDAQHFFLMIEPYVVPSMRRKLNLEYDYQPKWMGDEYYDLMKRLQSAEDPNE